jgi:hypothetical protein
MKTSLPFNEVSDSFKKLLDRYRCVYVINKTDNMVEYQVLKPFELIIRLNYLEEVLYPRFGFGMIYPAKQQECTDVQIFSREKKSNLFISSLVRDFIEMHSKKPWEGLGLLESLTAFDHLLPVKFA